RACVCAWYHRDISRVHAEDLLARAGKDGSYLVRDSESVPGAYALCLIVEFIQNIYLKLSVACACISQTAQGVQVNCFRTLEDLVLGYQHPHKGLVTPLLFPVPRDTDSGDESSGESQAVNTKNKNKSLTCTGKTTLWVLKFTGIHFFLSPNSPSDSHPLQKRDAFCQLLQLMKTRHSQLSEPDVVSVFVGTWNMGSSPPPRSLQSWVTCCGLGHTPDESTALIPHDIYALGTQENPQGEKEWIEHIKATLRSYTQIDFKQVAVQSLWNMRLAVFVKPEHENRISHVTTASVKTGLGNTLGNKGAVGVSFYFSGTSFGFVNCHLTSGSEKVLRRNQNFVDILRLLSLGDKHLSVFDISLRFTHLFWCGDLNYRLDLDVQDILKHVSKREFEELMCADQLTRERHKRKAFLSFKEEKITFPPTYRYERGSRDCYLWQKYKTSGVRVNVPSWCDRILCKSYPETHIVCTAYGCTDDIFTSDHSPVFATFQVGVTSLFSSKTGAVIVLEGIEAIVKTASKAKFFIEFHSHCLEDTRRSSENDSQSCDVPGFLKLGWSFKQLPKLLPVMSDMEYLRDQHLLLSVKSCDGFESYGECCVALFSLTGVSEQFETFLSHRGEEIGSIRGRVRIHVPKDKRGMRQKIYEWFCFEKDDKSPGRIHMSPATSRVPINR
uniref:phosphatidylinositol-3,4,5-trisphosphate 5-phosphatase n=1 Tax=Anabas testudineus TaxID=64144 RepID=A0A7N5ZRR4_ANATE